MIFTILGLLLSPFGILAILLGVGTFFLMPFIPRLTNEFHVFARFHQSLAGMMLKRAAIVASEQGDLMLKRMSPDDTGVELITFSDDTKEFEDPHNASSWWLGMRFALADEVHGVLFDPIDAALGRRKLEARQDDEMVVKATATERNEYGVLGWIRGVFEFPTEYELVDLNKARYLITGSERAEHPQRIKTFYELSREPYNDGPSASRLILLLVALIGPFAAIWILASQFDGPTSTVSFGALLAFIASTTAVHESLQNIDWKSVLVRAAIILPLPVLLLLIAVLVSPVIAIGLVLLYVIGFIVVPALTQVLKVSDGAAQAISKVLLKLGFLGYDEPVLELTPEGYRTREFRNLSDVSKEHVAWHSFLGRKFGFTFQPVEDVWNNEVVEADKIKSHAEMITDGGKQKEKTNGDRKISGHRTNIPSGYSRIPERTRAKYGDFVPKSPSGDSIWVRTGIALGRFKHAAVGQKSHKRLTKSKEEFGGLNALEDRTVAFLMVGLGLVSFIAGLAIFVLPQLL